MADQLWFMTRIREEEEVTDSLEKIIRNINLVSSFNQDASYLRLTPCVGVRRG